MTVHLSTARAVPGSPYAAELRNGPSGESFAGHLEREYAQSRLSENRLLIRVTCVLAALLPVFGGAERWLRGYLDQVHVLTLATVVLLSTALAVVACSTLFAQLYPPLARIIVPLRNALAATSIARIAAHGELELLMILPLMVVGPFFFLGLPFRVALLSVSCMLLSFVVSAVTLGVPPQVTTYAAALLLVITIACVAATRQLDERFRKSFLESRLIAELAEHDALTGTKNRRVFDAHLARVWQRAIDNGCAIAVLLVDVDHFKSYNDHYGHQAGDRALRRVAETLQSFPGGPLDLLARYGGEEFAVVLNDIDSREATRVADRMRRAVRELAIEHRGGVAGRVTISVGVAAVAPAAGREPRGALQLADQALYEAKTRGRNRVELMEEEHYSLLVTGVFAKSPSSGAAA